MQTVLPARGRVLNAIEVLMHHAEIVDTDVCKSRAARNLADRL
jgi:hypothetical protein